MRPSETSLRHSFHGLIIISVIAYTELNEDTIQPRNKLRLYKLAPVDVEEAISSGERLNQGDKWEARHGKLQVI